MAASADVVDPLVAVERAVIVEVVDPPGDCDDGGLFTITVTLSCGSFPQ